MQCDHGRRYAKIREVIRFGVSIDFGRNCFIQYPAFITEMNVLGVVGFNPDTSLNTPINAVMPI